MCKSNYNPTYNPFNIDYSIISNDNTGTIITPELLDYLLTLSDVEIKDLSFTNPVIYNWILQQLRQNNYLSEQTINTNIQVQTQANLENFSLAKTSKLIEGFKTVERTNLTKEEKVAKKIQFSKLLLDTQQKVENNHVNTNTQRIKQVITSNTELLEYVSERDYKVRKTHRKANGTIAPSTSKFWANTAFKLLGEWGCRCEIETALINAKPTSIPKFTQSEINTNNTVTDIDLEEGRTILFKESLEVFQNSPEIVRRNFNKNGF